MARSATGPASGAVECETCKVDTFVLRLKGPRPSFSLDMSEEERGS